MKVLIVGPMIDDITLHRQWINKDKSQCTESVQMEEHTTIHDSGQITKQHCKYNIGQMRILLITFLLLYKHTIIISKTTYNGEGDK